LITHRSPNTYRDFDVLGERVPCRYVSVCGAAVDPQPMPNNRHRSSSVSIASTIECALARLIELV
jgi:hypothetical protein